MSDLQYPYPVASMHGLENDSLNLVNKEPAQSAGNWQDTWETLVVQRILLVLPYEVSLDHPELS